MLIRMNESFDENPTLLWKNENFRFIFDKKQKFYIKIITVK